MKDSAVLLITCPDQKGLVATVSGELYRFGANIIHADQHRDHDAGLFFMRVEWALGGKDEPVFDIEAFRDATFDAIRRGVAGAPSRASLAGRHRELAERARRFAGMRDGIEAWRAIGVRDAEAISLLTAEETMSLVAAAAS